MVVQSATDMPIATIRRLTDVLSVTRNMLEKMSISDTIVVFTRQTARTNPIVGRSRVNDVFVTSFAVVDRCRVRSAQKGIANVYTTSDQLLPAQ